MSKPQDQSRITCASEISSTFDILYSSNRTPSYSRDEDETTMRADC